MLEIIFDIVRIEIFIKNRNQIIYLNVIIWIIILTNKSSQITTSLELTVIFQ